MDGGRTGPGTWRRAAALLAGVLLALSVAACGGSETGPDASAPGGDSTSAGDSGTPAPSGPGEPAAGGDDVPLVSLTRVGGLADGGVHTLVIDRDGGWVYVNPANAPEPSRGLLSQMEERSLRGLLADPALAAESAESKTRAKCADAVTNAVAIGASGIVVMWQSCATAPDIAGAIFRMLSDATAF